MDIKHYINITTIILIAITFIFIAGIFLYKHENSDVCDKNPIYLALGFAFATGGSSIIMGLFNRNIFPDFIYNEIHNIRNPKPVN